MAILGGAALAVIIAIVVICVMLFGGRGYKSVINSYMKASIDGNAKKIVSLLPDKLVDYVVEEEYNGDKSEMIDELEDMLDSMFSSMESAGYDSSDISYDILDYETMSKSEIEDIHDEFQDYSDDLDLNIKAGKTAKVEISVDGLDGTSVIYIDVVKIGRSWYLADFDF